MIASDSEMRLGFIKLRLISRVHAAAAKLSPLALEDLCPSLDSATPATPLQPQAVVASASVCQL